MKRAKRLRIARYLRATLDVPPPHLYEQGFADALALAELVAGWDLTRSLPGGITKIVKSS